MSESFFVLNEKWLLLIIVELLLNFDFILLYVKLWLNMYFTAIESVFYWM